jgi:hypothetical protein
MRRSSVVSSACALALLTAVSGRAPAAQIATTAADYVQPGTQPDGAVFDDFFDSIICGECHGGYRPSGDAPSDAWVTSMMAQSARDPLMRAAASIANADAAASGETCIRCHAPVGWLGGRSTGGDLANLMSGDLDGVSCHVCHRLADPITRAGAPAADAAIVAALDQAGTRPIGRCAGNAGQTCTADADCGGAAPCEVVAGQGRFVVDPADARRGPRTLGFHLHTTTFSPFHTRADACAPCHDVSTPTFSRSGNAYALNPLDAAHPTQDPNDMFPEQRTYSEWRASTFASTGVVFSDGRFGGTKTATLPNQVAVSTCQDCHMPDVAQKPCVQGESRSDTADHFFAGANTWVPGAVLDEYGTASRLTEPAVTSAAARTAAMLAAASDLEVTQTGYRLDVRVVNQTGHKLPTGYPEGRRMWLALRVFAGADPTPIAEDGAYDATTATLDVAHTTKLYEVRQVIAPDVALATGLAAGTPFHLVLAGSIAFDNRIPPRGFTTAAFDVFGGAPVGAAYADGQYWDDTTYTLPLAATRVEVSLYYQTTSREYAEFLRDTAPDASGQNAYDRWVARGKSAPVVMDRVTLDLTPICTPDDQPCDDADACTTGDFCTAGACVGTAISCPDDGNACTDDVCVSATGACGVPRSGTCDDGDACTTGDVCTDGTCAGTVDGAEGLRCLLDATGAADVCAEPLPRKLRRAVDQRVKKAIRLAAFFVLRQAAGAPSRVLTRLLAKTDRAVTQIGTRADAAEASAKPSRHITTACADRLRALVARERDALARLRESVTAASTSRLD